MANWKFWQRRGGDEDLIQTPPRVEEAERRRAEEVRELLQEPELSPRSSVVEGQPVPSVAPAPEPQPQPANAGPEPEQPAQDFSEEEQPQGAAPEPKPDPENEGGVPMTSRAQESEEEPLDLMNPSVELVEEEPAETADLDLLAVSEEAVQELERACGTAVTVRGNPFAIGVTVAQILGWQRQAATERMTVARALRAADALQCIYEGTIRDRQDAAQGKGALITRVPQLRALGEEASRQAELPQLSAPSAPTNATESQTRDGDDADAVLDEARRITGGA